MGQKNYRERTNTALFLLPLVGKGCTLEDLGENYLNTFLKRKGKPREEGKIWIEGEHMGASVNVPIEAYRHFMNGDYRNFSESEKTKILSFWGASKESRLYAVLYPKDFVYEEYGLLLDIGNIWPKPDIEKETFNRLEYEQERVEK